MSIWLSGTVVSLISLVLHIDLADLAAAIIQGMMS